MTESEFNDQVDNTLIQIEDSLDNCDADLDYETAAGILTITIESNDSKIIINRQLPLSQLWVAAKSGGYHFEFDEPSQTWLNDNDKQELFVALSKYCTEQSDENITLTNE
ncbi:Frataxin homolog CyaY, facilitates Fe-S cluster assembly, interacts with IscS [hydrothermal vent metagenome]|uniref:Frataxin homolog CyaY, facilitates Fe-S cluster assembly, interacts with IscS n=1 Tax=hydrothermal vent metagenome TaxID=652676 RepID=A0A3B1A5A7_9ZZZZ